MEAKRNSEDCWNTLLFLKADLLLITWSLSSPGYTIVGFGCQTHVASYCKMPLHCVLPSFHFGCRLGHCELSLKFTHNTRNMWGPPPLISDLPFLVICLSVILFQFFYLTFLWVLFIFSLPLSLPFSLSLSLPPLHCSFYWFSTPELGNHPDKWPRQKSRYCVFRPSETGLPLPHGCLCVNWKKTCLPLGRCSPTPVSTAQGAKDRLISRTLLCLEQPSRPEGTALFREKHIILLKLIITATTILMIKVFFKVHFINKWPWTLCIVALCSQKPQIQYAMALFAKPSPFVVLYSPLSSFQETINEHELGVKPLNPMFVSLQLSILTSSNSTTKGASLRLPSTSPHGCADVMASPWHNFLLP